MSYSAVIARLKNVRKHPNADRLQLANVLGYQVIVGLDNVENELGVFFLDDGQLSEEFCFHNNLYKESKFNKDTNKKGYFDYNRRIVVQRFRGEKSEGFWMELDSLEWVFDEPFINFLSEGMKFNSLKGKDICNKFMKVKGKDFVNPNKSKNSNKGKYKNYLKEHFDTQQLKNNLDKISYGSFIIMSLKLHGTSGRTGHIQVNENLSKFKMWWNKNFWWTKKIYKRGKEWMVVSGTRRQVIDPLSDTHNGEKYRVDIHKEFVEKQIPKGFTFYYEIVGYTDTGKPIQTQRLSSIKDEKERKRLERIYNYNTIHYSYGCEPKECKFYVYRITMINEDGYVIDLPWGEVVRICKNYDFRHVLPFQKLKYSSNITNKELFDKIDEYCEGVCCIDKTHPEEGVCLRVESYDGMRIYKEKSFDFKLLEGFAKVDPTCIDTEEQEE